MSGVDAKAQALRVDRATWWAVSEHPFYGALLARLVPSAAEHIGTLATDGRALLWAPSFVAGLSDAELRGVLIHEALHCAHGHMWRMPADRMSNEAGDHEINHVLKGVKGVELPAGALCDPRFAGMACEDIRRILAAEQGADGDEGGDQGGGGAGGDAGAGGTGGPDEAQPGAGPNPCGEFRAPGSLGGDPGADAAQQAADAAQLRQEWEAAVIQAVQAAQAAGRGADVPGAMAGQLERIRAQRVDWRQELADFVRQAGDGRADWSRPARRHAWAPVLLPSRKPDAFGVLVVARDTSGSLGGRELAEFCAAIDAAAAETGAAVLVLDCDSRIRAEYELGPGDECPRTYAGGGGTDLRPPFARVAAMLDEGQQVAGLVYLTDLDGSEPSAADFPVLWVSTTRGAVGQTGRTVELVL